MGGRRLNATGRCVFAMRVTQKLTFNEYWSDVSFRDKKPVRNGSRKMMVGDNIYHYDQQSRRWKQSDSHHSNADGSANLHNLRNDTKSDKLLISRHFFYFGKEAPRVPQTLLNGIGYRNGRNYRVVDEVSARRVISWIGKSFQGVLNCVQGDPFDFSASEKRYSVGDNKVT